jgi:zinc transporter ZupT
VNATKTMSAVGTAAAWGIFSASAFLIGSLIGVTVPIATHVRSKLMAFGGGALLVASAVEVFAPITKVKDRMPPAKQWTVLSFGLLGAFVFAGLEFALDHVMRRAQQGAHESAAAGNGSKVTFQNRFQSLRTQAEAAESAMSVRSSCSQKISVRSAASQKAKFPEHTVELVEPGNVDSATETDEPSSQPPAPDEARALPSVRRPSMASGEQVDAAGKQASFMVWLGVLADAVPESQVIGILANRGEPAALTAFVLGVFLANMPEAMSAAQKMMLCGMPKVRIVCMWGAITAWTGVGAVIGSLLFPMRDEEYGASVTGVVEAAIEGLAGGQLLSLVSNTILPEAFAEAGHHGSTVGLCCMLGFLCVTTVTVIVQDATAT